MYLYWRWIDFMENFETIEKRDRHKDRHRDRHKCSGYKYLYLHLFCSLATCHCLHPGNNETHKPVETVYCFQNLILISHELIHLTMIVRSWYLLEIPRSSEVVPKRPKKWPNWPTATSTYCTAPHVTSEFSPISLLHLISHHWLGKFSSPWYCYFEFQRCVG